MNPHEAAGRAFAEELLGHNQIKDISTPSAVECFDGPGLMPANRIAVFFNEKAPDVGKILGSYRRFIKVASQSEKGVVLERISDVPPGFWEAFTTHLHKNHGIRVGNRSLLH